MGTVVAQASMSLDGYIAKADNSIGRLFDFVALDLVPVVMGGGRPFFAGLPTKDVPLGDPEVCVPSTRVTHLRMPVLRTDPS